MNQNAEKIISLKAELEQARAIATTNNNAVNAMKIKTLELALKVRGVTV